MRMKWWKVLGLAGVVGVAATGVLVVRAERRRLAYTPEEVRAKLRERHAVAAAPTSRGSRTGDQEGHIG
ncbi:hypothetical protein [Dactylosporangium sp. CA-092794]|uniref:hypothetical protein n=1 Tax=Dactylosporangium sp. CA-092794 TaxID=3239929 RepID=UPI003D8E7AF9